MAGIDYRGWTARDDWLKGQPNQTYQESFPRDEIASDLAALSTGVMLAVAIPLIAGDAISNLVFISGATAAGTPTHSWAALYDQNGNLLQQSADNGAGAWAADTAISFALAATVLIGVTAVFFAAIMVAATTPNSLIGKALGRASASTGAWVSGAAPLARTSGSALTTTAPATIASPTAVVNIPYVAALDTRT